MVRLDEEDSGLALVLPPEIAGSLAQYYRHVVELFIQHNIDDAVATFTVLALDAYSEEADDGDVDRLWATLFTAYCNLEQYEDAYVTLSSIPDPKTFVPLLVPLLLSTSQNSN